MEKDPRVADAFDFREKMAHQRREIVLWKMQIIPEVAIALLNAHCSKIKEIPSDLVGIQSDGSDGSVVYREFAAVKVSPVDIFEAFGQCNLIRNIPVGLCPN